MELRVFDLGLIDFPSAWNLQKNVFSQVKEKQLCSALILCQHKPVITLGRRSKKGNILIGQNELEKLGIKTFEIERGGDITYHGPGQLCAYPIVNLNCFKKDIHWFLRSLESLCLKVLSEFDIQGQIRPGLTGVWIKEKKIASIGIAIRNWITFHGLSLNIKRDDLENFSLIRPCDLDIIMTSMESVLRKKVKTNKVREVFLRTFKGYFSDFDESRA